MQSSDTVGAFSLDTKRVSMSSAVETPFRFSAQQYDTDEISKPRLVTSERGLKPTPPFVFLRITRRLLYGHVLTSWEKGKLRIENPGKEAEDAIPDFDAFRPDLSTIPLRLSLFELSTITESKYVIQY